MCIHKVNLGRQIFDMDFVEACGNSVVDAGEQCDDGNVVDGDGCSSTCTTGKQLPLIQYFILKSL